MSKEVTVNTGSSWLGLLGVIFVAAKVFEIGPVADWSWWLVLLPFYLGLAIIFGALAFAAVVATTVFVGAAIVDFFKFKKKNNKNDRRF